MRLPRYYYESNFYHIMVQGDEKKYIFKDKACKKRYLYFLKRNAFKNCIEIIAYCVMDNHVHILLFCPILEKISKCMQQTNTAFGIYYNKRQNKVGHVYRDRYKSESILTKGHLINCIKYIHENPVKAKICKSAKDYDFSSYNDYYNISKNIMDICGFCEMDIEDILKKTHTFTRFIDDKYNKDDVLEAFNEVCKNNEKVKDNIIKTANIYNEMKELCNIPDHEIAKLLKIDRKTLHKRLEMLKE